MGRPKKPTALKEINGSAKKNPGRINQNEPKDSRGIGPAPSYFDKSQKAIWDEIVTNCIAGVLTQADRFAVEMTSLLLFEFRLDPQEFPSSKMAQLVKLCSQMGMTPADRSKIHLPGEKPKNPFESL